MKKILLLLFLLIAYNANAQKITYDDMFNDSIRVVYCNDFKAKSYTNNSKCHINLIGCENVNRFYKKIVFFIEISFKESLINENSIVTLKSISYDNIVLSYPLIKDNKAYFVITEKDLYRLSNGMHQIIVKSDYNIYNFEYNNDKVGYNLHLRYKSICYRMYRVSKTIKFDNIYRNEN